jgi:chromosome segregation ATPase
MNRQSLNSVAFAFLTAAVALPLHAADKPKADMERARRAETIRRQLQEEKRALEGQLEVARRAAEAETAEAQQVKTSLGRAQLELSKLRVGLSRSAATQATLQAELTAGQAAIKDLQDQLSAERAQSQRMSALVGQERARLEASRIRFEEALSQLETALVDARGRHEAMERQLTESISQTQAVLARSEGVRGALERTLADRTRALMTTEANRQGLEKTARELLVRFQKEGHGQSDPVFQFRRVAIDKDVEAYREVIDGFTNSPESPSVR